MVQLLQTISDTLYCSAGVNCPIILCGDYSILLHMAMVGISHNYWSVVTGGIGRDNSILSDVSMAVQCWMWSPGGGGGKGMRPRTLSI